MFSKSFHSLTIPGAMGHIWSKYGNGMGEPMAHTWVLYFFDMGYFPPYQAHKQSLSSLSTILLSYAMGLLRIS